MIDLHAVVRHNTEHPIALKSNILRDQSIRAPEYPSTQVPYQNQDIDIGTVKIQNIASITEISHGALVEPHPLPSLPPSS